MTLSKSSPQPLQSQSQPLSHNELLQQAKLNQINDLKNSQLYSKQLIQTLQSLIKTNSNTSLASSSNLIDKIITIHQLNNEIDKQLNHDIAQNYYQLIQYKQKLQKLIQDCHYIINEIDNLQFKSELIDQNLRILEYTLKLINKK
ncbi:conserved hypothetical protein [Candida dubliniensis CD36]|uniref:Uncharacterized protein n=1 Tax=Candida dubliniensis (strain CD36 / ATCC MYA-646 / CBS 7987 / NCPF 3949 / NRRL Y-17841) TaxID=573826 RepID=B9WBJ6_CANDC|nr:conserved hypothetical protein [Candida dubliniensis CD36]CAX43767.1 conserved hypothetical protein [Candida dubliniensis CD36]